MMELAELAAAAAALLAAKGGEGFAGEGGKAAWAGLARLAKLVSARFTHDKQARAALASAAESPSDKAALQALASAVCAHAGRDQEFRVQLTALIAEAQADPATRQTILQVIRGGPYGQTAVFNAPVHGNVIIEPTGQHHAASAEETALPRRTLFRKLAVGVAGCVSAAFLEELDLTRTRVDATLGRGSVHRAVLQQWEFTVTEHVRDYATRPPGPLLADLLLDISDVRKLLDECRSPRTQRDLIRVLGRLSSIISVVTDDLGATREARSWMRTARKAAAEVGDRDFEAWTYAREAFFLLHYERPPETAVSFARLATTAAGSRRCSAFVMAPTVEARALAHLRAERDAIAALHNAADALDHVPESAQRGLFGWSFQQLTFSAGRTLTTLGRTAEALAAQDEALRGFPAGEILDPALVNLDRAQAFIRSGDLTEGCRLGIRIISNLPPPYRSPLVASWADDALHAVPLSQRGAAEVRDFQGVRDMLLA